MFLRSLKQVYESSIMGVEQFDKLKGLLKKLLEYNQEAKFKIFRLEQENAELKEKLNFLENLPTNSENEGLGNLLIENERLKEKNKRVKNSLGEIVTKLEAYTR